MEKTMRNRYGTEYWFEQVAPGTWAIRGDLKYWRYGGIEGQEKIDLTNLGFADPSGGPFIELGSKIKGHTVTRIRVENDELLFDVAGD